LRDASEMYFFGTYKVVMPFLDKEAPPPTKEGFDLKFTKRGWLYYKQLNDEQKEKRKEHMASMREVRKTKKTETKEVKPEEVKPMIPNQPTNAEII